MSEKAKTKSAGRSMIEMLGVLAIIGVLSIGGLAAYKIAMNYHRANETMHDVILRATNVQTRENFANFTGTEFTFPDMGGIIRRKILWAMKSIPSWKQRVRNMLFV